MPIPDISQDILQSTVSDSDPEIKLCQNSEYQITETDIIPAHQASMYAIQNEDVDVRPRFFDHLSGLWVLLDTGAQACCLPKGPGDVVDPTLALETVDGSRMPCYGKKDMEFRMGRKTYKMPVYITNTTEPILGMDFIKKYKLDFRWSEFGDYYLYDTKLIRSIHNTGSHKA